jgi:hypothetical protein
MHRELAALIACAASLIAGSCGNGGPGQVATTRQHVYALAEPEVPDRSSLTAREERWRSSLVGNLGHRGDVHTFVRVDVALLVRGVATSGLVYADLGTRRRYYVRTSDPVIVDFGERRIGCGGVDGISFHPHPQGRFVVGLVPTRGVSILGVPLSDASKCGPDQSVWDGRVIRWTWPWSEIE